MTLLDIAQAARGKLRDGYSAPQAGGAAMVADMAYGTATADSANGFVTIVMDNMPAGATQSDYEFTVACDAPITDGDRVALVTINGMSKAIALATVSQIAQDAEDVATATNQHFWSDTNGIHVSTDENDAAGTRNILINSLGILLRKLSQTLVSITESAVAFFDGSGNQTASFGSGGAVVGMVADGESRTEVATSGLHVYQRVSGADTSIADLGYGLGNDSGGGTANAPYYSLGTRLGQIGNWSVAEGYQNTASHYASHAEGYATNATGFASHSEGEYSLASGRNAHAEGNRTKATNDDCHAEGSFSEANGMWSHAQNLNTRANGRWQTAIGKYNIADTDPIGEYALIIGNGTDDNNRSNAFTVAWDGTITASGEVIDGFGNKLSDAGGGGDTLATLYDNSTGTGANSTLTLSSTSADYDYLDIIFTDGNRRYTERLYDPNGKTFSLFRSVCSGTTIYHNTLMGSVSGTTVTLGAEAQATINNGAVGTSTSTTLKVIKVFGGTSTSPSSASGVSF